MADTRLVAFGVVAVLLAGIGAAVFAGIGPAPGGADDRSQLTDYPTGTPIGTAANAGSDGSATPPPPFSFSIDRIDDCGRTCRDVTATLFNNQGEPARDVTVLTRIYAGRDNTADGDLVWSGREAVGTLEADGAHTATTRVELSFQEALAVEREGGWVTVVTTVKSAERTVTFKRSRQVA